MEVKAIYRINERYVIGDDKNIYRLPFLSNGKMYSLRKIKKYLNGFFIDGVWIDKTEIKYQSIEPFLIIKDSNLPF
jgi:hypothetical protein